MCSHVLESLNLMTLLNRWITHTFSVTRIARERQDELEFASMRPSRQLPSWCGSGWVVNVRELSPLISCQLVRCRIMVPSILYCSAIVIVSVEYMHLFRRPTQSISRLFIVCQCQFMAVNIRSFLISVTHLYTCTLKRCSLWHMHKAVGKVVTLSTEQFVKKWPNPLCSGFVCCCCCSFASNAQGHTWFTSVDLASSPRHAGTRRPCDTSNPSSQKKALSLRSPLPIIIMVCSYCEKSVPEVVRARRTHNHLYSTDAYPVFEKLRQVPCSAFPLAFNVQHHHTAAVKIRLPFVGILQDRPRQCIECNSRLLVKGYIKNLWACSSWTSRVHSTKQTSN